MLIELLIASLFQVSSSLLHVHKLTHIANHDDYTICLRYVVYQLGFDSLFDCDVIHDLRILVFFVPMKLIFSIFFAFGNGGRGGNVHMTSGGNEFITFIIIAVVGIFFFF
jgi:hypothetical protein